MSHDAGTSGPDAAKACEDARDRAPRQWIYRNLTPWRIHASFTADGELLARRTDADQHRIDERDDSAVLKVLSVPALGEIVVPAEDARHLNTINLRRLGQLDVRPAPGELSSNLPRIILIFGWLLLGLVVGSWALFFGGGSRVRWSWAIAAAVVVPVVALVVAGIRELLVYRKFDHYRQAERVCRTAERPPCGAGGGTPEAVGGATTPGRQPGDDGSGPQHSLEGIQRGLRVTGLIDGLPRKGAEIAVLAAAVVVCVVGLGLAIHLTTQLDDLVSIDYGKLVALDNPVTIGAVAWRSPAFWQLVVGHVAQWVLVSVAALTPAAMYFQFDRQRLASIQRRWIHEVFRLDPTVRTVPDIEAKYDSQIEASFGDLGPDSSLRIRSTRRSPVVVATIVLVVGWFLVISTTRVPHLVEAPPPVSAADGSIVHQPGAQLVWSARSADDATAAPVTDPAKGAQFVVSNFFTPNLTPVGYAFLGSYVFTLFHVLRGYQRRDLQPKTYNTVVVRILSAYVLALLVSVAYRGPAAEVAVFFVGFMPESALVWLKERLASDTGLFAMVPLREPAPLTNLEGIDLYDRTRLAEEGVNNIEALAHANLVELMSSTRISAAQLVDWVDQAILYLRLGGDANARTKAHDEDLAKQADEKAGDQDDVGDAPAANVTPPNVRDSLNHLRWYGIRTASDLLAAYEQALRRGRDRALREGHGLLATTAQVARYEQAEVQALRCALEPPGAPRGGSVLTIQTIIDALPDEEWFAQIRNWHDSEFNAADSWYWYLDGHDWTLTRAREYWLRAEAATRPFVSVPMADVAPGPCADHSSAPAIASWASRSTS